MPPSPALAVERTPNAQTLALHVVQGRAPGRSFRVLQLPFVIGRGSGSQLKLSDALASRQHCVIEQNRGGIFIRDLASRNGTAVNSRRVTGELALRAGDLILIGSTMLRLELVDSAD